MSTREREPITHGGRTLTLKEWARELGVSYNTLHRRFARGMPVGRALCSGVERRGSGDEITHEGRTQRLSEWAREAGIRPLLLEVRLAKGWPMEKALKKGTA